MRLAGPSDLPRLYHLPMRAFQSALCAASRVSCSVDPHNAQADFLRLPGGGSRCP